MRATTPAHSQSSACRRFLVTLGAACTGRASNTHVARKKENIVRLHNQIFFAMVLAVACGAFTEVDSQLLGIPVLSLYDTVGTLFLNEIGRASCRHGRGA